MKTKSLFTKNFPGQSGDMVSGKVRDVYPIGSSLLICHTTDRVSAFDHILPVDVPHKGSVLSQLAAFFMRATDHIIPNCLLSTPHETIQIWEKCKPFKIEVVVRAYNTGSFWRDYSSKGIENPWDISLPENMRKNERFPELIITPTTKEDSGHDIPISATEIIAKGLCTKDEWEYISEKAKELFQFGSEMAAKNGLILVDTKYEFGINHEGKIVLIDEVHTPDSSRYWYLVSYQNTFGFGKQEEPKGLSKEYLRTWLRDNGFTGEEGKTCPEIPEEIINKVSEDYKQLYTLLTGEKYDYSHFNSDKIYDTIVPELMPYRRKFEKPAVLVCMGSESDLGVMEAAIKVLDEAGVVAAINILSAHRTPESMLEAAKNARNNGIKVIIAGAGGAAHLPGMMASSTTLPVIGVPVKSSNSIDGWDSVLSILQMPSGVPVATVALNGAANAGLLALQILATTDDGLAEYLANYKDGLQLKVAGMQENVVEKYYK
jgi:phosphoribosylaminoimidazole-succinocarboxamide synthase